MSSLICSDADMQTRAGLAELRPGFELADDNRALTTNAVHLDITRLVEHDHRPAELHSVARLTLAEQHLLAMGAGVAGTGGHR
ncbi:MAG: hypothetical protein O7G84_01155 [Gammaproteobacteria bacterium]|nr:hypothetical protein [Gammaproteobacteria bacterium]